MDTIFRGLEELPRKQIKSGTIFTGSDFIPKFQFSGLLV
jgi:hypothetical protein